MNIIEKYNPIVLAYDQDWLTGDNLRDATMALRSIGGKCFIIYRSELKDICEDGWMAVNKINYMIEKNS